jgi:hypothetical protein
MIRPTHPDWIVACTNRVPRPPAHRMELPGVADGWMQSDVKRNNFVFRSKGSASLFSGSTDARDPSTSCATGSPIWSMKLALSLERGPGSPDPSRAARSKPPRQTIFQLTKAYHRCSGDLGAQRRTAARCFDEKMASPDHRSQPRLRSRPIVGFGRCALAGNHTQRPHCRA